MDSQNSRNKNNFFRYLPFHHLTCWKVNLYWDKRQVPFHIKMTCEQHTEEECARLEKLGSNQTAAFSHQLRFCVLRQLRRNTFCNRKQAFSLVQEYISEMIPCLTFIKRGPRHWQMNFITHSRLDIFAVTICSAGGMVFAYEGEENRIEIPILSSGFCYLSSSKFKEF